MMSNDDGDLEQLIKGGPFELGLYADKLGSHMFGIESGDQVAYTFLLHLTQQNQHGITSPLRCFLLVINSLSSLQSVDSNLHSFSAACCIPSSTRSFSACR